MAIRRLGVDVSRGIVVSSGQLLDVAALGSAWGYHSESDRRLRSRTPYIREAPDSRLARDGHVSHSTRSETRPGYNELTSVWLTFSHLVLKVPTTHIRGADMSVTVHLDPIFNVESEKTSPESWRNNPEKL